MLLYITVEEFRAKKVQSLMQQYDVRYFSTQNETMASASERAILTIKQEMYRYFTYTVSTAAYSGQLHSYISQNKWHATSRG